MSAETLSTPPPAPPTTAPISQDFALSVEALTKSYDSRAGALPVLKGISMALPRGRWIALMGPSGSGKSTFLHCCAGLLRPTSGRVVLDDVDLAGASPAQLTAMRRTRVGFVFQAYNLIPALTAAQNVALPGLFGGKRPKRDALVAALDVVGLADRADHRPEELSGGEQQRVAIARTLLQRPAVVFADEPTGALDSVSGATVLKQFSALTDGGASVLMVTHDPNVASKADLVLFLADGLIVDSKAGADAATIAARIAQLEQGAS